MKTKEVFKSPYLKKSYRAQLASLVNLSAPRARDLIVAIRALFFLDLALSAQSYTFRIHSSLFLII